MDERERYSDPELFLNEGVEEEDTGVTIKEPFDPNQIRIESLFMPVASMLSRLEHGEIDLAPDFQRRAGIWTESAQSRLIESLMIRIPLPAFYMDGTNDDKWVVVDGLQRLTALRRFVLTEELRLDGLQFLSAYSGMRYSQLPRALQRRIRETVLTVFVIKPGTPDRVKFDIFQRINTGGIPLSSHEIRRALYRGQVNGLLEELASSEEFLQATDRSIRPTRMADQECVLRFMAFWIHSYEYYQHFRDFDGFLNDTMETMNTLPDTAIAELKRVFLAAMETAYAIFGRQAFRKQYAHFEPRRYALNKALFEVWSVCLGHLSPDDRAALILKRGRVNQLFASRMDRDRAFDNAVSQGTGDPGKVIYRFSVIESIIAEVLA